jgi:tetratricopeptide (TPR) repeat protein
MQVLASGQAGLFAIQTSTGFDVERIDTGAKYKAGAHEIKYYFAGCNDVTAFSARTEVEARTRTELAWSADRAVRLFVILLDPKESSEDLVEVGEALDELLALQDVVELVERQIFSAPLPEPIDVQAVIGALEVTTQSSALLKRFLDMQSVIARVRVAFDNIDDALFENQHARRQFLEEAIDRGCVRALVQTASSSGSIDDALFRLYSALKGLENNRAIIKEWTRSFERANRNLTFEIEPEERHFYQQPQAGASGRKAFEKAMRQQVAIFERILAADFDTARRYARELLASQRRTSSPEHVAKSLSSISQQAKHLDVIELALEWALQAVEAKPDDVLAHTQLADLLMRVGRYVEAHQSLDLAQSFGAASYAASGRARILRYQGQFAEALNAYREADACHADDVDQKQFNLAGIAECLRDLEELDEALAAYDKAIAQCPYVAALHAGRAATLVDLARYDDAFTGYKAAMKLDDHNVVPRNGIASLFRRAGKFDLAEKEYSRLSLRRAFTWWPY